MQQEFQQPEALTANDLFVVLVATDIALLPTPPAVPAMPENARAMEL